MTAHERRLALLPLLAAVALLVHVAARCPSGVSADDGAIWLARKCASEAGLVVGPDCAAIADVLRSRFGGAGRGAVCAYGGRVCDRSRTDSRRWVAHLRADGRRPEGWPARASWSAHRGPWRSLLEHARGILAGTVTSTCDAQPDHWGMRHGVDLARALQAGWVEVDCGNTMNAFWRVRR